MKFTQEQKRARRSLLRFLTKLGIKSAETNQLMESMQDMMDRVMADFGKPDQIFMPGAALESLLESLGQPSPRVEAGKVELVQSEGAPADKRGR